MREQVLQFNRERDPKLLYAGDRVAVAVSGGADSVALLRVLLELRERLGLVLHVAHFNHQLRGEEADADERFVAELARQHDLPFFAGRADVRAHAETNKLSIEHAARELRYQWLLELAHNENLEPIATAHNADDQAETVLMRFLRGAGTEGLAGIHPFLVRDDVRIVRPLLTTSRAQIEEFLHRLNQPWREDHTNRDTKHTRNRIRHELLPLLERDYNPGIRRLLRDTAEIARTENRTWLFWALDAIQPTGEPHTLSLANFTGLGAAIQRRLLKTFLEWESLPTDFHHIEKLRRCAIGEAERTSLAGRKIAVRVDDCLKLVDPVDLKQRPTYRYTLSIPGSLKVPEIGARISATVLDANAAEKADPGTLLPASSFGSELTLRNWLPGDRFRPAHSGSEKKLKELFAEKKISAEQRPQWPVVLTRDFRVVWVRGFPVAHDFAWTPGSGDALKIEVIED